MLEKHDVESDGLRPRTEDECEKIIMSWAAEHPEPVYPAWRDWLRDQYPMLGPYTMTDILESPIPADIAEKLGLQPKEG